MNLFEHWCANSIIWPGLVVPMQLIDLKSRWTENKKFTAASNNIYDYGT